MAVSSAAGAWFSAGAGACPRTDFRYAAGAGALLALFRALPCSRRVGFPAALIRAGVLPPWRVVRG